MDRNTFNRMKKTTNTKDQNTMGPMMGATSTSASYEKSPRSTRMNVSYAFVNEWYSSSCDPNVVIAMAAYRAVTAMKMMQKWNKSDAATVSVRVITFKRS